MARLYTENGSNRNNIMYIFRIHIPFNLLVHMWCEKRCKLAVALALVTHRTWSFSEQVKKKRNEMHLYKKKVEKYIVTTPFHQSIRWTNFFSQFWNFNNVHMHLNNTFYAREQILVNRLHWSFKVGAHFSFIEQTLDIIVYRI